MLSFANSPHHEKPVADVALPFDAFLTIQYDQIHCKSKFKPDNSGTLPQVTGKSDEKIPPLWNWRRAGRYRN